jgi:hypothetical protein
MGTRCVSSIVLFWHWLVAPCVLVARSCVELLYSWLGEDHVDVSYYLLHPVDGKLTTFRTIVLEHLDKTYMGRDSFTVIPLYFSIWTSGDATLASIALFLLFELMSRRALKSNIDGLRSCSSNDEVDRTWQDTVISLLRAEIETYERVYLVLDALDETSEDLGPSLRDFLVTKLPEHLSILCASRPHENIMNTFRDDETIDIPVNMDEPDIWKQDF